MANRRLSTRRRRPRSRMGRRGAGGFLQRYGIIAAVAAILLIAGIVLVILLTGEKSPTVAQTGEETAGSSATATPIVTTTPVPSVTETDVVTESGGPDILIDPSKIDENMVSDAGDIYLEKSDARIGITIGSIETQEDRLLLTELEKSSAAAEKSGDIFKAYCYVAGGDYNQQIQDVRGLIQNEVDVIIVGCTDADTFSTVSHMAAEAGIPVVTYESSATEGYAANVITDWKAWGEKYGSFIKQNLLAGGIVQILGSETEAAEISLKSAIDASLSGSGLTALGSAFAAWNSDTAKQEMTTLLGQYGTVDGVITEEGMAAGILDSYIETKALPKVFCADATAGFIKKWYALKHGGVVIVPVAESKKKTPPPAYMMEAKPGELIVCAQPAPRRSSVIAFEIAVRLAEGRQLKTEGSTYTYQVQMFITDENLDEYYDIAKDMPDSFVLSDKIDLDAVESLFNPEQAS